MKLLTNNMKNGVLLLNKKTLEQLKQKHHRRRDADPEIMLPDKPEEIHPIKFDSIDAEDVRKAALKTRGRARPSGLDDDGWKRIFTSNQFGDSTDDLCKTFAEVIKNYVLSKISQHLLSFSCESIDPSRQKSWTKTYRSR